MQLPNYQLILLIRNQLPRPVFFYLWAISRYLNCLLRNLQRQPQPHMLCFLHLQMHILDYDDDDVLPQLQCTPMRPPFASWALRLC